MKKLLFIGLAVIAFQFNAQAQNFKVGASVGIPSADASDVATFVVGVDAYYYFSDSEESFQYGATVGFRNFFGDEVDLGPLGSVDIDDQQFLPIAVAGRYNITEALSAGADVGYALGLTDGLDGGFYFRPIVGYDLSELIQVNISYENISDAATWGAINAGILFSL